MGDGAPKVHPPAAGKIVEEPPRNLANYRISDDDRLGEGSLKQKFKQNLAAIQALRLIEAGQRPATPEEKALLVKYVGWGGLPAVFAENSKEWGTEGAQLAKLLTEDELNSARATTLNAHYTSPIVIRAMYSALERLGFKHGRILEPACGIGHFIGLMPEQMHRRSVITGIEIDPITARIARTLYPDADIRLQPFEQARLADSFYDAAISNVPFGDYQPFDLRFKQYSFPIHDYFFAAALEKARSGGLILFITSKGTMDKLDSTLREYLAMRVDLLGAIRLPNTAFKKNANTEVTTDILMLRRLFPGEQAQGPAWNKLAEFTNRHGETFPINEYFAARPEMMLGEMRLTGRMYQRSEPTLEADDRDLNSALASAVARLPEGIYRQSNIAVEAPTVEQTIPAPDYVKPNAYTLVEGEVAVRDGEELKLRRDLPAMVKQRVRGLIRVRDAVRECLRSQLDGSPEETVRQMREALNHRYDYFTSRYGPISARPNTAAFRGDPDLPLLLSLEHYDEDTKKATKAAIFRERTIQYRQPIKAVATSKEALLVSLNEKGRVDLNHMAALLARPAEEFIPELKGILFLNPQSNAWETDDHYLSGNVREKLAAADAASLTDPRFKENVTTLQAVQPEDLPATAIDVRLGASWLPESDVRKFIADLLSASDIEASYNAVTGSWLVEGQWEAKQSVANTTEWGTNRASALDLIQDALNLKTPTIYDTDPQTDKSYVNAPATEAARDKQQKIKERFKEWIWHDDERRERLCRSYNDQFNNVRLRTFNGDHLTLPGASQVISLHPHQKAGIWRILQTPNTLLGHVVGAGKTYTMVAAAMELKRLGLARKPLFTVPNHMLGQFSSELLTLYPGANILVAGRDDFESGKRRQLMSRIATGNWDAVIVTHSGFEKIPLSERTRRDFFNQQLHELDLAIRLSSGQGKNSRMVKDLERARKRLQTRLESLAAEHRKDNTLTFEELGIDRLFVDEAHYFKNLFYVSNMTRVAGLPQTASERAFDMFLKVGYIQSVNRGGGVIFATGTPIANSMAEMYTMQRYLQMGELRKHGLHHFDRWAGTFGEPVTAMELAPDGGGYRLHTRFARFINVPELMQQFRQMADVQTAKMLQLPVPLLENEKPAIVKAPCSPALKKFVAELVERAEALKKGRVDPSEDNMLKITSEGRKAALDLRLMIPSARDDPQSKVNLAAQNIHRVWEESASKRSTQLVFCDLSTPKDRGFSVYRDTAEKLEKRGVPREEIAFMQDYDSDAAKLALFKDVRAGKVRILFGSTQKMGSGTNVQDKLIALHHLDAPWRPADVEQREGRILRQGNTNPLVHIYRYVTEGSFDAYMWQTLETKAKFIHQVMSGDMTVRRIEDVDSPALTYAEVKAIASGNPMVIEKASIDAELMRLSRLRSQHSETQYRIRDSIRSLQWSIKSGSERITAMQQDVAMRPNTAGDAFTMTLDGQTCDNRGVAGELLLRHAEKVKASGLDQRVGQFGCFEVWVRRSVFNDPVIVLKGKETYPIKLTDTALGLIRSTEHTVQTLDGILADHQEQVAVARKQIKDYEAKVGQPFEYEEKFEKLLNRQDEIIKKLDLTKNQAASQLEADATETQIHSSKETRELKPKHHVGNEIEV